MTRELRIGIFVGTTLLILAVFIFIVGDMAVLFNRPGYMIAVIFDSAAGLENRSVVKMSGVKIGYIKDITLSRRKARITIAINPGVEIPKDSKATASSLGLLGEKFLDIIPGDAPDNCRPGDELGGLPTVGFDQIGGLLQNVGTQVKDAGQAVKDMLGPETRENFTKALQNLAALSSELRDFVARNQGEVRKTVSEAGRTFQNLNAKVEDVAAGLKATIQSLKDIAAENRENVKLDLEGIKALIGKIEESLRLLNSALEKVNRGEGSLGKLIQDPGLYTKAEQTFDDVNRTARSVASLRLFFDFQADLLPKSEFVRSAFMLGLRFSPRAFLETGLVRDPWKDAFTFSLVGGYRLGSFVPRFGFIESQFGLGVDYYAFGGRWLVRAEGFDFNRSPRPRIRVSSRFFPWTSLYVLVGADDLALASRREVYFGLGVALR